MIDSLTTLGKAAYEWSKGQNPGAKDPRQWYFTAQQALENIVAMTTSEAFHTNLIIISHINFRELPSGEIKGYASTIGSARAHYPEVLQLHDPGRDLRLR